MFWLWVIALLLAIPTYLIAKKQVETQIISSLILNAYFASIIMNKHREKYRYSVFDNLSDNDFMALIQEIHRRLRIEVQAKLVGKYGKGINEIILNQRQDEAGINMMANGIGLVLKMCEDNDSANIPGSYLLHEIATTIADKIYENYLRL